MTYNIQTCLCTYRMGQKRTVLRIDNFVTVSGKKVFDMTKVSKFCLEKCVNLDVSEIIWISQTVYFTSEHIRLFTF